MELLGFPFMSDCLSEDPKNAQREVSNVNKQPHGAVTPLRLMSIQLLGPSGSSFSSMVIEHSFQHVVSISFEAEMGIDTLFIVGPSVLLRAVWLSLHTPETCIYEQLGKKKSVPGFWPLNHTTLAYKHAGGKISTSWLPNR